MQTSTRVLLAIFSRCSKSFRVSRSELAGSLELQPAELERAIAELERAQYVDATRLRLTMHGLAVAAACAAEVRARRRGRSPARSRLVRHDLAA
jgi:DNA-binding MarR family transcriptional regulator